MQEEARMSMGRNVSLSSALGYRGQAPMLTYWLHRIGGVCLFVFFIMYILALLGVTAATTVFANWLFQVVVLFFALFHAINGMRITLLDLWPKWILHYRRAIWIEWAIFIVLYLFALVVVVRSALAG
jgi:succinate dehydrogenase / fumarate reductase cytochrome b subunit